MTGNDEKGGRAGFNVPAVVLCGVAVAVFVYAMTLFLQGMFLSAQAAEHRTKFLAPPNEALQALRAEQQAILQDGPRWLDEAQGRACIPITEAKARLVQAQASAAARSE